LEKGVFHRVMTRRIGWAELVRHNTENDAWISIDGEVYNITAWLNHHPGGRDILLLNAGRDATQLFQVYHGPLEQQHKEKDEPARGVDGGSKEIRKLRSILDKYYIGQLEDTELPKFPPPSQFHLTLKKRVDEYFEKTKRKRKSAPSLVVLSLLLVIAVFGLWSCAIALAEDFFAGSIVLTLLAGVCSALLCLIPVHEASHASLTRSPWVWRLMGAIHDVVNGASFYMWCHQHFLGHHPYTNLPETDPDIHTNEPDIRRIKPSQSWHNHYKWQQFYAPVLYGLLAVKFRLNDLQIMFFNRNNGKIRVNPPNLWHMTIFIVGKTFWFTYRFILPSFWIPLWKVIILVSVADLMTSYYLALTFQVNHVVEKAVFPSVSKAGVVEMDWAVLQVRSTVDYAHGCRLTTFLTGALNYQVVHHLFPYVSQVHYPQIASIVRKTCKEFGVPYTVLPSFWDALKDHVHYLYLMGSEPKLK
jgi:fatty acid desaturase/predicted heme/steroid binding protein